MLRRVVYTTNAIESLNYQLRKITKNRGHFPSEEAAVKLLWLAICNIEDKRAAQRLTDAGKPPNKRTGHTRLIQGHTTTNWKQALAQLTTVSSPGFCVGLFRPLSFVLLCVCFLLVAV